jgi:hypothetical protein
MRSKPKMTCANKALMVLIVVMLLGLWGCTQNPGSGGGSARVRDLESRNAKLEIDYRAAVAARDQLRKQAEEQRAQIAQQTEQAQQLTRERDELRQQVTTRTGERDNLQSQLAQFRKELQDLLGRVEAAANGPAGPALTTTTTAPQDPSKS